MGKGLNGKDKNLQFFFVAVFPETF